MMCKWFVVAFGLVLVVLLAGCELEGPAISITGSGDLVTQEEDLSGFDKVDVSHAFQVDVRAGDDLRVIVRVDDNVVEHLEVAKEGRTLRIGLKRDQRYNIESATLEAEVTLPELTALELSGASHVTVTGFRTTKKLGLDLSGASSVRGDLQAGDARFDLSGASQVQLTGSAGDVTIDASGASVVRLEDFAVRDADVDASGASKVTVNASGRLDAEASGASHVIYLGSPTLGKQDTSGTSSIRGQ
jgi:hypothetical protein